MKSRYEAAQELGFEEPDSKPGLLYWKVRGIDRTIFMDFRTRNDKGEYTGYSEDMPPRLYAAEDNDDSDTNLIGPGDEGFDDKVKHHWAVEKVERDSGRERDKGQASLDWFEDDDIATRPCVECNSLTPIPEMEEGLCLGENMNGCYYDKYPSEMFRDIGESRRTAPRPPRKREIEEQD